MSKSNGNPATFQNFALSEPLLDALEALKFETPTPIQAESLPHTLAGRDLIGCAQTGTGKTAAFLIPLLTRMLESEESQALVLAPTRELALQIQAVAHDLAQGIPGFRSVLVIGGVSMFPQKKDLARKPALIVATPGRLVDHLRQGSARLDRVRVLVLDEADRMLDMGFAPQLKAILQELPTERQTMLFSATIPSDIVRLAKQYLRDPARVTIGEVAKPVERIEQDVVATSQVGKGDSLVDQINKEPGSVLVFARTKRRTDRVARFLHQYGLDAAVIHGDRSQRQREEALERFRSGDTRVLVATDIASRGLDIPEIQLVVNYDLPDSPEDYVHRIGRTARAGKGGRALIFVTAEDREEWNALARFLAKKGGQLPDFKTLKFQAAPAPAKEGEGFRRPRAEGWQKRGEEGRGEYRKPSRYGQRRGGEPGSRYGQRESHGEGNARRFAKAFRPASEPRRNPNEAPRPWQRQTKPWQRDEKPAPGRPARFFDRQDRFRDRKPFGDKPRYDGTQRSNKPAERGGFDRPKRTHGGRKPRPEFEI